MIKSAPKFGEILGINVSGTPKTEVLSQITQKIARKEKFLVVTPNPAIILQAQNDSGLRRILNSADFALSDGVGLILAARFLGQTAPPIIKGRQLVLDLMGLAAQRNWRIFLLGGEEGVAEAAEYNIYNYYNFYNYYIQTSPGPFLDNNGAPVTKRDIKIEKDVIDKINKFTPQILFVGFGCPKQEKWLAKWLPKLKIGGAMVVGGTFDYLAGRTKLPPRWMENLGLEWLWRLLTKPGHFRRVWQAAVVFPWKVFVSRLASQSETLRS